MGILIMGMEFIRFAVGNTFRGFGNILMNGFDADLSQKDKDEKINVTFKHFCPINRWEKTTCLHDGKYEIDYIVDKTTAKKVKSSKDSADPANDKSYPGDEYCGDTKGTVRWKCAALFAATFFVQPIGLVLNVLNKIGKVVTFAHLWSSSPRKCSFKARLGAWIKDIALIVVAPLLYVGMIFSSFYGAIVSPYDGRKLYGSFERLAYSGGYQFFPENGNQERQNYLLAPCFQPSPTSHLGGGSLNQNNVW